MADTNISMPVLSRQLSACGVLYPYLSTMGLAMPSAKSKEINILAIAVLCTAKTGLDAPVSKRLQNPLCYRPLTCRLAVPSHLCSVEQSQQPPQVLSGSQPLKVGKTLGHWKTLHDLCFHPSHLLHLKKYCFCLQIHCHLCPPPNFLLLVTSSSLISLVLGNLQHLWESPDYR